MNSISIVLVSCKINRVNNILFSLSPPSPPNSNRRRSPSLPLPSTTESLLLCESSGVSTASTMINSVDLGRHCYRIIVACDPGGGGGEVEKLDFEFRLFSFCHRGQGTASIRQTEDFLRKQRGGC